ncbi:MAG: hypothetical protein ACTSPB_03235 [Candidatus Thorarchaeota archaeon]
MKNVRVIQPYHRLIVVGAVQSGKTTFIKDYLIPALGRFIVYDPDLHFGGCGVVCHTPETLEMALRQGITQLVYQPTAEEIKHFEYRIQCFEKICAIVNGLRHFTLVVDEIRYITRPMGKKQTQMPPEFAFTILRRMKKAGEGRKGGRIGVFVTTQRLKDSDLDLVSQAQHMIIFRLEKVDINYIEERINATIRDKVVTLKPYHYLHYCALDSTVTTHAPIPIRKVAPWKRVRKW